MYRAQELNGFLFSSCSVVSLMVEDGQGAFHMQENAEVKKA